MSETQAECNPNPVCLQPERDKVLLSWVSSKHPDCSRQKPRKTASELFRIKQVSNSHQVLASSKPPSAISRCPHGHADYYARSPGVRNCPASATMLPPLVRMLPLSKAFLTPKSCAGPYTTSNYRIRPQSACSFDISQSRPFRLSIHRYRDEGSSPVAQNLSHNGSRDQDSKLEESIAQDKEKQIRAPWHREGSDIPPAARRRSADAMTQGMGFSSSDSGSI